MKTKNKNLIITVISLLIIVVLGILFYQNYAEANIDATCTQNIREIETEIGQCGDVTWDDWIINPDNDQEEIRTGIGHLYTDIYA